MKRKRSNTQGRNGGISERAGSDYDQAPEAKDETPLPREKKANHFLPAYALIVCIISFFIYGFNYSYSPGLFWDENYHVTSAQKYIDGVFFMGDHPPLGKELIALGESILKPNKHVNTSAFLTVDKIDNVPKGFSFVGMRFMPAFLAVLSGIVFFFILFALMENTHLALLFSGLYLFENAFVVHSRGAMLDSIQLFFVLLSILWFVQMIKQRSQGIGRYLVLGMLLGAATAVKLNALLFIFLPLVLFILEVKRKNRSVLFFVRSGLASAAGFLLIFLGSYVVHIYLTPHVLQGRYYEASYDYKKILDEGKTKTLWHLPLELRDQLLFIPKYHEGVPKYDASKEDENGSLPYTWPFMNKTIDYRWEKNDKGVRYLYLVGNPLHWCIGLCAVILSTVLVVSTIIFKLRVRNKDTFQMIVLFVSLYWFYMAVMMKLERVMYLYHYFIPLIMSYLITALLFLYFYEKKILAGDKKLYIISGLIISCSFLVFLFFSPLSYYQPLTFEQFELRNWFPWWHMVAIR